MKKLWVVLSIILCASSAWGACTEGECYVRPSGGTGGGTSWADSYNGWGGIQTALSVAGSGDTVYIGGGTYTRVSTAIATGANNVIITASDDGDYGGTVTLDCNNGGTTSGWVQITHDNITFTGTSSYMIVLNNYQNNYSAPFIRVTGDTAEIAYVQIYDGSSYPSTGSGGPIGVELVGTDSTTVHDSLFYYLGAGKCDTGLFGPIGLNGTVTNAEIYNNTMHDSYNGIWIGSGSGNNGNLIHDNTVYNMWNAGIGADGGLGSNNEIYDNTIYDCHVGNINIWHGSTTIGTGWKIYRNLFYFTQGNRFVDAIFLEHLDSSYIYNNVIYDGGINTSNTDSCGTSGDFHAFRIYENANNNEYYNNTIYSTANGSPRVWWLWGQNMGTFKNNVTYTTDNATGVAVYYEGADTGDTWENNAWYNTGNSSPFYVDSGNRNFSYWQGLGYDSPVGYNENPDFKNTSNLPTAAARTNDGLMPDNDVSSPLIDSGADLSLIFTDDFLETTRDATFDIGAYEYEATETGNIRGVSITP